MPADQRPQTFSDESPDWYRSAACRDVSTSAFYPPDNERGVLARRRVQRAKQICDSCPVIRICLATAISAGEKHGIWGGLTPQERQRLSLTLGEP